MDNFIKLWVKIFFVFSGKRGIHKIQFLTRRSTTQHSCRNIPVIWRKCRFSAEISKKCFVRLVTGMHSRETWSNHSSNFRVSTKYIINGNNCSIQSFFWEWERPLYTIQIRHTDHKKDFSFYPNLRQNWLE